MMVMRRLLVASTFLCAAGELAVAGGRGGHNTRFDPNLFPGATITCAKSLASGACGPTTFSKYYNAACNGSAEDTELFTWTQDSIAGNPAKAVLYVPPGSICHFETGFGFLADGAADAAVVNNPVIWGYGASMDRILPGGRGFYQDGTHEALIEDTTIGDVCVTLKTAANSSRFAVADWISVNGLGLQHGGFPPNNQFGNYRNITSINGTTTKTVCFTEPLTVALKSNWPVADTTPTTGPAGIFKMQPSWNLNAQILGLTMKVPFLGYQYDFAGRSGIWTDVQIVGPGAQLAISVGQGLFASYSQLGSIEFDKMTELVNLHRTQANITVASGSFNKTVLTQHAAGFMNGWGQDTTIVGGHYGQILPGPGYGASSIARLDGVAVFNTAIVPHGLITAWIPNFSSGVFTIANNDTFWQNVLANAIPGFKYAFADVDGTLNAVPQTTFSISSISSDGTNTSFTLTGCSWGPCTGPLPTPTCRSMPCPLYLLYPGFTITQINSPPGSADLTQFAAPP